MALIDPGKLLTITAAAKRVPHSEIAIRRLIRLGRLPVVRIGRSLYVHETDLTQLTKPAGT